MKDSIKKNLIVLIFAAIAMIALFACSQNSDKPSPETNSGSPAFSSQEDVSSSYYDDDWYQSESSQGVDTSNQSTTQADSSKQSDHGFSYEEYDDSADWTPIY